jgi:hypothetical protein
MCPTIDIRTQLKVRIEYLLILMRVMPKARAIRYILLSVPLPAGIKADCVEKSTGYGAY